jgi:ceramide glucosyltransferase
MVNRYAGSRPGRVARWADGSSGCEGVTLLAMAFAACAAVGLVQCLVGWCAVRSFMARPSSPPRFYPPVTILRPLCGDEPMLTHALASCLRQDYPVVQIILGVQDADDPALAKARDLQRRHPEHDIAVVVDSTVHGCNKKVANLINMLPHARHDVLVVSDSDLHLPADYLTRIVAALQEPNAGLVSTLSVSWPASAGWAGKLGACQTKYTFLPGSLTARLLGRRDCLGSTMALHRTTLERSGGLAALAGHLADDNVLGQRVAALGLRVGLADTLVAATAPERTFAAVWQHEMRWARTIRALVPVLFGLSALQYPCVWALLACLASRGAPASLVLLALAAGLRMAAAWGIERALRRKLASVGPVPDAPVWLTPVRDILSIVETFASYSGSRVVWRGTTLHSRRLREVRSMQNPALVASHTVYDEIL